MLNSLIGKIEFDDLELQIEINTVQSALNEASLEVRRLSCLLTLLEDEKERRKNNESK